RRFDAGLAELERDGAVHLAAARRVVGAADERAVEVREDGAALQRGHGAEGAGWGPVERAELDRVGREEGHGPGILRGVVLVAHDPGEGEAHGLPAVLVRAAAARVEGAV